MGMPFYRNKRRRIRGGGPATIQQEKEEAIQNKKAQRGDVLGQYREDWQMLYRTRRIRISAEDLRQYGEEKQKLYRATRTRGGGSATI